MGYACSPRAPISPRQIDELDLATSSRRGDPGRSNPPWPEPEALA